LAGAIERGCLEREFMRKLLPASLAFALAAPVGALADTASDIRALRQEIDAIRADYEARLQALEQRLKAAEAAAAPTAPPVVASSGGGLNAFNPSLSLILSGLYTRTSHDPANYTITGFQLPSQVQIGPGSRGLSRKAWRRLSIPSSGFPEIIWAAPRACIASAAFGFNSVARCASDSASSYSRATVRQKLL